MYCRPPRSARLRGQQNLDNIYLKATAESYERRTFWVAVRTGQKSSAFVQMLYENAKKARKTTAPKRQNPYSIDIN